MSKLNLKIAFSLMLTSLLTFSTAATSSHVHLRTDLSGDMISYTLKIPVRSAFEMGAYSKLLKREGYDVAGYSWRKGTIEVITDQAGIEKLNAMNFNGMESRAESEDPLVAPPPAIDPRYLNPNKVEQKLKELNQKFQQFTRLEQIGTSLQGRAIWALLVSTTPNTDDPAYASKPSIIFDGMHHAREIMTSEVVMDVAENTLDILSVSADAPEQALLIQRWNIWVVPMLNVDGNNIVWTQNKMWRKNARSDDKGTFGVDINRNYPFNWDKCNGASDYPFDDAYRGPSAASEPETKALVDLAQKVRPTGSLSYHSFSELILYPYGCNGVVTGDNALVAGIANELSQILPSDTPGWSNYDAGAPWQLLYDVDGDSMSFMHGEFGALAITFEINQKFQPGYDLRAPTITKHRKAWNYFLNRMDTNLLTLNVVDARTNQPTTATIGISSIPLLQDEKPFRTNAAGYYFKVLNPGDYTLSAELADGRTKIFQVKMEGTPQALTISVD